MSKKSIIIAVLAFIVSAALILLASKPASMYAKLLGINTENKIPQELYRVYLAGESLGVIKSKTELEDYIDSKQEELKKKYNVSKVYAPNDLKIMKEITYNEKVETAEAIYDKLEKRRGKSSFTIDGYKIDIEGITRKRNEEEIKTDDLTLYVIDKNIWDNSVKKTVTAFIDEERYNAYIDDTQEEIKENATGQYINNLYIQNKIKITKGRIPAEANVYTKEEDLSQFLLFGNNEQQETYTVKVGDTIADIADANQLSVQ